MRRENEILCVIARSEAIQSGISAWIASLHYVSLATTKTYRENDIPMRKTKTAKLSSQLKYAARFEAEKARQQKRYCDAFALWRNCHLSLCLRIRACRGDPGGCLAKAVALACVPRRVQWQTRQDILSVTPRNIGAPERAARQCMPIDFYAKRGKR
jgi:hypothetical protein